MKKKNNLLKGLLTLAVLGLVSSGALAASTVYAAYGQTDSNAKSFRSERGMGIGLKQQSVSLTDAQKQEMTAKQEAVRAALDASDYNAWVTAVKAGNANSPVLAKINASNFARYVEAYKLQGQAHAIMTELGLNQGQGQGMGMGGFGRGHMGEGLGLGRMMKGNK